MKYTSLADCAYFWAQQGGFDVARAEYTRDGSFLLQVANTNSLYRRFSVDTDNNKIWSESLVIGGSTHPMEKKILCKLDSRVEGVLERSDKGATTSPSPEAEKSA